MMQKQTVLEKTLNEIVSDERYPAALLSDSDGFLLAEATIDDTSAMMAAVTALLRQAAAQARQQLALPNVNELTLVSDDRFRLVCRFFQLPTGQSLSLTVMVAPDASYRRVTNNAIKEIQRSWAA
jgi:predicted regulator of Ras-like GTPase activity (Roadblock/LC7/MglB family)